MSRPFIVLFVGLFLKDALTYNPLLTYSLRFKRVTMLPNISGQHTIDQFRYEQFINANFTLDTNKVVDSVVVIINRCKPEGFDCEYFQTWKLTDLCSKLIQKNQVWSRWYGSYDPPMVCPINNKEHYKIINGTFDISLILTLYPEATNYQWIVVQKFHAGDEFVGGYTLEFGLFGYRKRTQSILKI